MSEATAEAAASEAEIGVVHWDSLIDTNKGHSSSHHFLKETVPHRPSPHRRELSTMDYGIDQDAYDAARDRPTFSRSASMDTGHIVELSSWGGSVPTTTGLATSTHSKAKSGKKSKDAPMIPAAQLSGEGDTGDRIRLGICAMDKKARSKPMAEILSRLDEKDFQVVFFGDDMILNRPVEEWPICDVVVAFFSKGYPLPKAKEYVALRKPFILNDLEMQEVGQAPRQCRNPFSGMHVCTNQQ